MREREFGNETLAQGLKRYEIMSVIPPSGEHTAFRHDRSAKGADVANDFASAKVSVTVEQILKYVLAAVSGAIAAAGLYYALVGRVTDNSTKADAQFTAVVAKIDSMKDASAAQAAIQSLRDEQAAKDTAWLKGQVTMQGLDIRNIQLALAEKGFKIAPQ